MEFLDIPNNQCNEQEVTHDDITYDYYFEIMVVRGYFLCHVQKEFKQDIVQIY